MQPNLTCTTEELILLLTLCGYQETAKGLGESVFGEKSTDAWDTLLDGASHQLMLKGVWDYDKAENDEVPLTNELQDFIKNYASSPHLVRLINQAQDTSLLFHSVSEDYWIEHIVVNGIIHEFGYVSLKEIKEDIRDFYLIESPTPLKGSAFVLTPNQFELLSDSSNVDILANNLEDAPFKDSFINFKEDLNNYKWQLDNISRFYLEDSGEESKMTNILFLLPSKNGIWCIKYIENDNEVFVAFELKDTNSWIEECMNLFNHTDTPVLN
ncbi:hypothetical protein [Alkalicoccobacillus porphyridii]|uniref:Uncharacterized protein n=1 Tax=Alkalicoccobacillus porphyridii TaxID=2597270 RepID=A0A553ZUY0_9BACI|nr:hypothetical protein [Alkalicoccobacillus porphyridii]TSB45223.1 hypothetical protein FN960_17310 [Alkalicoccobacillus porphyridii]